MLTRFLLYGCAGWVLEVLFTGASAALKRDRSATATTYLWMHPIYGATALGLEALSRGLAGRSRGTRALAYTAAIFGAEYATGWALRRALGRCPWDYGSHGWSIRGLIRLDYAPAWYATGLLFEPLRDALVWLTQQTPSAQPLALAPPTSPQLPARPADGQAQPSPEYPWEDSQPSAPGGM